MDCVKNRVVNNDLDEEVVSGVESYIGVGISVFFNLKVMDE